MEHEIPDTRVLASMSIRVGSYGQGKPSPYEYVGVNGLALRCPYGMHPHLLIERK